MATPAAEIKRSVSLCLAEKDMRRSLQSALWLPLLYVTLEARSVPSWEAKTCSYESIASVTSICVSRAAA